MREGIPSQRRRINQHDLERRLRGDLLTPGDIEARRQIEDALNENDSEAAGGIFRGWLSWLGIGV